MLIINIFLYLKLLWYLIILYTFRTFEENCNSKIGATYFELGQYDKAISYFIKSEDCNSDQNITLKKYNSYYLGFSFLNFGNHHQAAKYLERYLLFDPQNIEIIELVGWCNLLLYKYDSALDNYLKLIDLKPNTFTYLIESAKILFELGKKDDAHKKLELAKMFDFGIAHDLLIDSIQHRFNTDLSKAVSLLERASNEIAFNKKDMLFPQLNDIYILLSDYKKESGDLDGTISVLEYLCKIMPDDFWAINRLAFEYADQGVKLEKALSQINHCLKYQPENSFFLDTKGWILYKIGRMEEAKKMIEKSLELNPNVKETKDHYRMITDIHGTYHERDKMGTGK